MRRKAWTLVMMPDDPVCRRVAPRWATLLMMVMLGVLSACDTKAARPPRVMQDHGVAVIRVEQAWVKTLPVLRPTGTTVLGPAPGDAADMLRVAGGMFLSDGRVALADDGRRQLRFYSADGRFEGTIGRGGGGPDEYQAIRLIPNADRRMIATVDLLGQWAVMRDSAGRLHSRARVLMGHQLLFRFGDGTWLARALGRLPSPSQEGTVRRSGRLVRLDSGGAVVADFGTHPAEDYALRQGPRGPTGGEVPFGRRLLVAAADSLVVVASTGKYAFALFGPSGAPVARVDIARRPTRVPAAFRRRFRDSVLSRFGTDPYGRREWTLLTADDVFPTTFAETDAMVVGPRNTVWVRDFSVDPVAASTWTIFDRNGLPLCRAELPAGAEVLDVLDARMLVLTTDAEGQQSVGVLHFAWPDGR